MKVKNRGKTKELRGVGKRRGVGARTGLQHELKKIRGGLTPQQYRDKVKRAKQKAAYDRSVKLI